MAAMALQLADGTARLQVPRNGNAVTASSDLTTPPTKGISRHDVDVDNGDGTATHCGNTVRRSGRSYRHTRTHSKRQNRAGVTGHL